MARIKDREIVAICESQIASAAGYTSGELSQERADAMDYYLGEPYGNEQEDRSQVVTREVLATVEAIMPSLMRIFSDRNNIVEFDPVGEEDEESAQQESDMVSYWFWKKNRGFYNLYSFCKDALQSKTGILKVWWDDSEKETREEYRGLDDIQLGELLFAEDIEREVIEYEKTEDGHHIVFHTTEERGLRIEPCPPEEFGVSRRARSPYAKDSEFTYHRTPHSRSDLIEAGYPRKLVERIPASNEVDTEERLARRNLTDEQETLAYVEHRSAERIWVTECYTRLDRNNDGIAELLKVTLASGTSEFASGSVLLDVEEVDRVPFCTAPPNILTHKFYGLSIADLVMDLQLIDSTLVRGMLDNMYLANNSRLAVNDLANIDDVMTSRPGGAVRVEGEGHPLNSVGPIPHQPVPQETFQLLEYLNGERKDRTGVGGGMEALDPKSLSNVNTGVAALAVDEARAKIEMVARILAEVGLRSLFQDMHELLSKNISKAMTVRLRGKWVKVNPGSWRGREDLTINVGLGIASKERRMLAHEKLLEMQMGMLQAGAAGSLLTAKEVYRSVSDYTEELGLPPDPYWLDPEKAPPQEPKPDPTMMALELTAKVEAGKLKVASERNQVDMFKAQSDAALAKLQTEQKQQEAMTRTRLEQLKGDMDMAKTVQEGATQEQKLRAEFRGKLAEKEMQKAEMLLEQQQANHKLQMEKYKADLDASVKLQLEAMKQSNSDLGVASGEAAQSLVAELRGELESMREEHAEQMAKAAEPKTVQYDDDGRIYAIGDRVVGRDLEGRPVSV